MNMLIVAFLATLFFILGLVIFKYNLAFAIKKFLKKHKQKFLAVFATGVMASSGVLLFYDDIPILPPADEPPVDGEAYFYEHFVPPSNSFGMGETVFKTVNWSFFKQKFQDHFYKDAMYKRYSWSDWTNGNSFVGIDKTWNETNNFWKINITLDVPVDIFEVNISFGCDLPVLDYVDREGYEIWLNYTANETETYQIYFNWSDIANIPGITVNKHKEDGIFWVSLHRQNIPSGFYVFDPNFGCEDTSGTYDHDLNDIDDLVAIKSTPASDGTLDKGYAYVSKRVSNDVCRMLIYKKSDLSFVAQSSEVSVTSTSFSWKEFDFSGESISGSTEYLIGMQTRGYGGGIEIRYGFTGTTYKRFYDYDNGNNYPSYPATFTIDTELNGWFAHYCSYTEGGATNTNPGLNGNAPVNGSTGVSVSPDVYVIVTDADGDTLNVTWHSNSSGSWVQFGSINASVSSGTNITQNFANASAYSTEYWWSANVSDGEGGWHNVTYDFTTEADSTPDSILINFSGNLGDSGGPYYRPPGETTQLTGIWSDGYYTNDSRQQEDWIYINTTIPNATSVWLNWLNETSWTNWTYSFINTGGTYWEINTSGIIETEAGYNYSFDVYANGTGGSYFVWWNKTGLGGTNTRRYVSLNNTLTNISNTPFYLYNTTPSTIAAGDVNKKDRYTHDQGIDGTQEDTGMLLATIPDDTVNFRWCDGNTYWWFDNNNCTVETIENIYFHVWVCNDSQQNFIWYNERGGIGDTASIDTFATSGLKRYSYLNGSGFYTNIYAAPGESGTYNMSVMAGLMDVTDTSFTENNISQLLLLFDGINYPYLMSNRSAVSFVVFNIPPDIWDGTDNSTDTDGDGLSDHMELNSTYGTCTSPWLSDTDNDGVSDYDEHLSGSDPNNYTDTTPYSGQEYMTDIRTNDLDYFVYLGVNCSAYEIADLIDNESEITFNTGEYIALWKEGGTWDGAWNVNGTWYEYHPHNDTGENFSATTFDVIKINVSDNQGQCHFNMTVNTDMNYTNSKAITLVNGTANKGYNFSTFNRDTGDTTLSAINTSIGLDAGEYCGLWNETNYNWDIYISGFELSDADVHQWSIIVTKVEDVETWNT